MLVFIQSFINFPGPQSKFNFSAKFTLPSLVIFGQRAFLNTLHQNLGRLHTVINSSPGQRFYLPGCISHYRCLPVNTCLLYTSDAADEEDSVDLGGRRIIKKKK